MTNKQRSLSKNRILNKDVAEVFRSYPAKARPKMRALRALIIETAELLESVGVLYETLKWGEPSYVTSESRSGSTVRIDWKDKNPDYVAIYFKCTTDLVSMCRK